MLMTAFQEANCDIFKTIASEWHQKPIAEVEFSFILLLSLSISSSCLRSRPRSVHRPNKFATASSTVRLESAWLDQFVHSLLQEWVTKHWLQS